MGMDKQIMAAEVRFLKTNSRWAKEEKEKEKKMKKLENLKDRDKWKLK
jgi:hypothetical protein